MKKIRITFNAPVVLGFSLCCLLATFLGIMTNGFTNRVFFSVYRSPYTDLLSYVRLFLHVFGHVSWEHFAGNITMILLIGPLLEEKYGSKIIFKVILITALVTGIIHCIFSPGVQLLGASGVVFAFIVLSSITSAGRGEIPLTFILIVVIYLGGQIYDILFIQDEISNLTHIIGGLIGGVFGLYITKK